jgi:serine/threonine-protein kinase RsbT
MNANAKSNRQRIKVAAEGDVGRAVHAAHLMSATIGFKHTQRFMIATAVSELAQNMVKYAAGSGSVVLTALNTDGRAGIEIVAADFGPGIKNIEEACREGFSTTRGSLGLGLSGARRLMDEFRIDSKRRVGTRVVIRKWL